ncbi:MAG TPA: carboxypeptidase regulatory-like domain-containing protein [Bryobacteraceae bacterium]|nr:carboxypeptidase regulatory-like domain-containing protein [Bryobacteraceae bacterium]
MRYLILLIGTALSLHAQNRAQVLGVVRDGSGAVVRDAAVTLLNQQNGVRRASHTNDEGLYNVSSLPQGSYKITIRRSGFRTVVRLGVEVGPTDAVQVDFMLEIGSMQETVTVHGNGTVLNTADASTSTSLNRDTIEQLPLNGRGLLGAVDFSPGVLATPATAGEAGQFSVNGQRPNTNYFMVDGVSGNNSLPGAGLPGQFSGGSLPSMTAIGSLEPIAGSSSIEQVRVQTSMFNPEFGRMPGANIAVSSRSGSNELHGDLFGSFRHRVLSASDPIAARAALPAPPMNMGRFGATVGGPIRKERSFFFAGFETLQLRQPVAWITALPGMDARRAAPQHVRSLLSILPTPNGRALDQQASEHTAQVSWPASVIVGNLRVDHVVNSNALLFLRYSDTPSDSQSGFLNSNALSLHTRSLTGGLLMSLSPTITSDLRFSFSGSTAESTWSDQLPPPARALPEEFFRPPLRAVWIGGVGQFLTGGAGAADQRQWNLAYTMGVTARRHQFRFGVDYQRLSPDRKTPFNAIVESYTSLASVIRGDAPSTSQISVPRGSSLIETFSFFAQDTWLLSERLSFTFGSRLEITPAPYFRPVQSADTGPTGPPETIPSAPKPLGVPVYNAEADTYRAWTTRYNQWAPRAGFAYRLTQDGTAVLRAGAGLFYNLGLAATIDALNGLPFNRWRAFGAPPETVAAPVDFQYPSSMLLPRSLHWNVSFEKELSARTTASASYVGSLGQKLLRREAAYVAEQITSVMATNHGHSSFQSLQLQMSRQVTHGLQGMLAYTWSHALDNGSWDSALYRVYGGNREDWASADFDVRHSIRGYLTRSLPSLPRFRWATSGWVLTTVLGARTGFPLSIVASEPPFGLDVDNIRPDLVPNTPIWIRDPSVPQGRRLNPLAFAATGNSRQGTLGRNAIRGVGMAQLDASLERRFQVSERVRLEFRAEAYNLANNHLYADPVRYLSDPLFGQSTRLLNSMLGGGRPSTGLTPAFQSGGPRTFQLKLRLGF